VNVHGDGTCPDQAALEMVVRGRTRDRDVVTREQRRHVGLYEDALKAFFAGNYQSCIDSASELLGEKDDVPARRLLDAAGKMQENRVDPRPTVTNL